MDQYDLIQVGTNQIKLQYSSSNSGAFDPTVYAWRVLIDVTGLETTEITEGPLAGDVQFTGGTITRLRYVDDSGNLLLAISELSESLILADSYFKEDNANNWFDYVLRGGNTYIGANDSMNSEDGWDGDDIDTSYGDDTVKAAGGDDFIKDAGGTDIYNGGAGDGDTVAYDEWFWNPMGVISGVTADLGAGTATGPDGHVDTLIGIENLRGSFLDDTLLGNWKDNRFVGYQGDDYFDGRNGWDRVRYDRDDNQGGHLGIVVRMRQETVRDGFGFTDTIVNIEAVRGTDYSDVMVDNGRHNYFDGRGGDDLLRVSAGNDGLRGGAGADTFEFMGGNFGDDEIYDFNDAEGDKIKVTNATAFGDLTISQDGGDALIEFGGNSIRIEDFLATDLGASDFIF